MVGRGVPAGSVPCATPPDRPRTRHGHPSAPRFSTSAAPSRRREKEPRRPVATRRDPQLAEIAAGRRRESARSCSSSTRPRSPARPRLEDTRRSVVWPSRERGRRRRRRLHGRPRPTCHRPAPARARRGSAGRGAQGSERRAAEASTRRRVGRRSVARDGWDGGSRAAPTRGSVAGLMLARSDPRRRRPRWRPGVGLESEPIGTRSAGAQSASSDGR